MLTENADNPEEWNLPGATDLPGNSFLLTVVPNNPDSPVTLTVEEIKACIKPGYYSIYILYSNDI